MKQFTFDIDYAGKTREVTKHWQFCVGSCHAATAQRADYVEQLKLVHDELGFERVRFHGVFDDDMNVCVRPGDHLPVGTVRGSKVYNFYQVGRVYDNLLKAGVKPFVEIGFMPSALASGKKTVFYYKGNVTLPKKFDEWQDFIRQFASFLIDRYGIDEVRTWYFEVWNEPNLGCFFKGTMDDYFKLYEMTVRALKEVDSQLMVGGPATTCSRYIPEFREYCKKHDVPVDFISTHQYPTDALGHSLNKEHIKQLRKMKFKEQPKSMRAILQPVFDNVNDFTPSLKGYMTRETRRAKGEVGDLPLFYTEWSISSNCVAAIHDTTRASSFLVKTVLDNQGIVDGSSYWTFSDIFEELFFFTDPFFGGFGLLTIDGIKKPAYWAFKQLAQLPDTRYDLPITDDDVEIAAFKGDDGVYLMLYAQNFDDAKNKYDVTVNLKNIPHIQSATIERINDESGNPVAIWEKMGKPAVLKPEEIENIKRDTEVKAENLDVSYIKEKSEIKLEVSDNEIVFIKLKTA